ncbi:thioredoxin domain-containing protein 6 isoform X5 [Heterocephalus glaber]|uniref:Thioredoxin domain-containing protein 6 isoform X5 n=1 Tax=Heterocephalus glaber TaxID=10181 RepID=A0AAX6S729_HETGA|nr:thioredoxin domain-containing protein 6 isoform X5 [Heterocephalus glaber]
MRVAGPVLPLLQHPCLPNSRPTHSVVSGLLFQSFSTLPTTCSPDPGFIEHVSFPLSQVEVELWSQPYTFLESRSVEAQPRRLGRYPGSQALSLPPVSSEKTCTLAIIKPDAVVHGKTDEIIVKIQEAGFDILTHEERIMTEAEMRLFYQHRAGEIFEKLVYHMCSGPSHLLILTRTEDTKDVVTAWRDLMGPCDPNVARREQPESLRAQYGTEMPFNAVHGSRDREDANRELALLFPSFKFSDEDTKAFQGAAAEGAVSPTEAYCVPEDMNQDAVLFF